MNGYTTSAPTHGIELHDTVVLAHSLGAVIATAWVHDYAPPIRGLILATPAFRVKLYVPFAVPLLRLRQQLFGPGYVKSFVKASMLTHDPEQAAHYNADPLIFRQIAVNMLLDLHDTSTRLLDDAGAITVPLLVLAAGSDWVVQGVGAAAIRRARLLAGQALRGAARILPRDLPREGSAARRREGARLHRRALRGTAVATVAPRCRSAAASRTTSTTACASPGGLRFAPVRWLMKGPGRLSRGIDLGWKHGFDSGVMLDYIYENRPQGLTPLGRLIDRSYLNAIGWRGIRVRRTLLEQALRSTHRADSRRGPAGATARHRLRAGPLRAGDDPHACTRFPSPLSCATTSRRTWTPPPDCADELGLANVTLDARRRLRSRLAGSRHAAAHDRHRLRPV